MPEELLREFEMLLDGWRMQSGTARHPDDRARLIDFFSTWEERGVRVDREELAGLLELRDWDEDHIRDVLMMAEAVSFVHDRRAPTSG